MTDQPEWFRDDLEPDVSAAERGRLWDVAQLLTSKRPDPRPALRAALRERLAAATSHGAAARSGALWLRIVALAVSGSVLLGVVVVGLAGGGPFAA
jgi:hypothetical protein